MIKNMKDMKSLRHYQALQYALEQIRKSELGPLVESVYLYGSCARGEEKWNSDVDLLVQLKEVENDSKIKRAILILKGSASTDDWKDPEADLKFVFGAGWKKDSMLFYKNVKREGIEVWR